jgi:hypothetical protein
LAKKTILGATVLQAWVGGPLLFTIFINEFADNSQIYLSFSANEVARAVEGVNTDLRSVECSKAANDLYGD